MRTSSFLILNLFIILSAAYFGTKGAVIFGLFSVLAGLLQSLWVAQWEVLPLVLLLSTTSICYAYCLKAEQRAHKINLGLDSIEEKRNVLTVETEHLRRQNAALEQKLRRYAALKDLTEHLSSMLTPEETFALITAQTLKIIGKSTYSLLYLVDKKKQKLSLVNTRLPDSGLEVKQALVRKGLLKHKQGDVFDHWVLRHRARLIIKDATKDFRFDIRDIEAAIHGVRSLICAPLIRQNKLVGILRLDNLTPEVYDADDLRLLDIIADLSAVAIENTLLYQRTEKLAITDGLTGLFVHRHFQKRFDEEITRSLWTNSGFSFLMLDVDDFKSYNDRYGHISGDIVLKQIAQTIAESLSPQDIVARYGGEEFGALLVDTAKNEAAGIAERIREKIEKMEFIFRRQSTGVRISGGVSGFPVDAKVKENLVKLADEALYTAKAQGKNRICVA